MASCLVCCAGSLGCCCCGGACCLCWTAYKGIGLALQGVKYLRSREPCPNGLRCNERSPAHHTKYSHPDDDDYGFAVRIHGGKGEFCTLRQCFNFMDPYQQGYVNELAAFKELLAHVLHNNLKEYMQRGNQASGCFPLRSLLGLDPSPKDLQKVLKSTRHLRAIWKTIDTDGNTYISFPEFVEWASGPQGRLWGFPTHVGIVGEQWKAGDYNLRCTIKGCSCMCFQESNERTLFCLDPGCGHKRGFHAASALDQITASLPPVWSHASGDTNAMEVTRASGLKLCGQEVVDRIQELFDASARRVWTRDRGRENKVPSGFKVVKVERNENVRLWLKYIMKRALIKESIIDGSTRCTRRLPKLEKYRMLTSSVAGPTLSEAEGTPLDQDHNEWFLWHGASSKGAKGIADSEFKQVYAGTTTGTLYGRGTYLSDSCTKADEYAKPATEGADAGLCCVLLCRVMGGRVRYTDAIAPSANGLERDVLQGPYDSVFGDREKCRGTFKEIVIYESSQAFPLYLVYYNRLYEDDGMPWHSSRAAP